MNYKTIVLLILTILVYYQAAYAVVVDIPDPNLEALIRETIGKPEGDITDADLQGITSLNSRHGYNTPDEEKIADLTGLEYCTNLQELRLSYNHIIDISVLAGLLKLQLLLLDNNQIIDISALADLTNLQLLWLAKNQITDISALAGLLKLQELALGGNQLTDLSALSGLLKLHKLTLANNQITDLSALSELLNLQWLALNNNRIIEISALSGLMNLQWLALYFNHIIDISALSGLNKLRNLNIVSNQISDIFALSGLLKLQELRLGYNQISDISALSELINLKWLHLSDNQISDIQPLVDNPGIDSGDEVWLDHNPLNYASQKTHILTLEGRGVYVEYYAKGVVTLDSSGPPTWSYTLTRQGGYVYNWFYEGAGITGASVTGEAEEAGWTVEYSHTLVTFSNSTPLQSGLVSGFEITGNQGGTGSWLVGRNSGSIEGPTSTIGDVSGDGTVTAYDAMMVLKYVVGLITFTDTQKDLADVSKNGTISPYDAALILQYVIGLIPSFPETSEANAPVLNVTSESELLAEAIKELESIHLNDEQKRVLEQLKRSMSQRLLPKEFALLQNYPNPFNPETWIPFKLANDVPVTISIYNAKGQRVRTLERGNKKAGVYTTKERAAYWNGRDEVGQKVASGLYYYTIEAGEFKATRRMLMVK